MKDTKNKIILEIILIPLCVMYLYYELLHNHPKVCLVLMICTIFFTCVELTVKYVKEVYVYNSKFNFLKILMVIFSFAIIVLSILSLILKYKIIKTVFYIMVPVLLAFLIYFIIKNFVRIKKEKGPLYKNAIAAFFSMLSFVIILISYIIIL